MVRSTCCGIHLNLLSHLSSLPEQVSWITSGEWASSTRIHWASMYRKNIYFDTKGRNLDSPALRAWNIIFSHCISREWMREKSWILIASKHALLFLATYITRINKIVISDEKRAFTRSERENNSFELGGCRQKSFSSSSKLNAESGKKCLLLLMRLALRIHEDGWGSLKCCCRKPHLHEQRADLWNSREPVRGLKTTRDADTRFSRQKLLTSSAYLGLH